MPKVSVIMGVYNMANEPPRGLKCILEQKFDDFEIVVVNDGSDDATQDILEDYRKNDSRIRLFRAKMNMGLASALNIAVSEARSEILMRMDIDDWSHPQRMRKQYDYLMSHYDVGMVGCAFNRVYVNGHVAATIIPPLHHSGICRTLSLENICLPHGGVMMRKNCFFRYGFYNPYFRRFQDYELWLRWRPYITFANLDEILVWNYMVDTHRFSRINNVSYWKTYQYDFLARYLNFPQSKNKLLDLCGWIRIQIIYFVYKPIRWLTSTLYNEARIAIKGKKVRDEIAVDRDLK